jgi:predicted signal transduction protein with EAL and GGDEF domain
MRQGDTLARIGGDEFVVLLENIVAIEDSAGQVARKILGSFAEPFSVEGHTLSCSCSIGIAVYPSDATDPQTLIRDADTAMYHVKENGRGSYRYFSGEMNTRMQERLQIEIGLRKAIAERQFELVYQPKVNIESDEVTGLEALLRWRHPDWGLVTPDRFIAVAEDTGLIVEIGRWVVEEVCRQLKEWRGRGVSLVPVAINLSVRQFTPALLDTISAAMAAHGVTLGQIEVEITEPVHAGRRGGPDHPRGLSQLGARVTIDDFGTATRPWGTSGISSRRAQDRPGVPEAISPRPRRTSRSCARSSPCAAAWASRLSPRAWNRRSSSISCASSTATSIRATFQSGRRA